MAETARIKVLSVDDHPLLRQGIGALVDAQPDMVDGGAGGERARGHRAVPAPSGPT